MKEHYFCWFGNPGALEPWIVYSESYKMAAVKGLFTFLTRTAGARPNNGIVWVAKQESTEPPFYGERKKFKVILEDGRVRAEIVKDENQEKPELKACPFCGGWPEGPGATDEGWWIECPKCEFDLEAENLDEVVEMWNTRATE